MGITNTVANISGFVAPYIAGMLINGNVREFFHDFFLFTYVFKMNEYKISCLIDYFLRSRSKYKYFLFLMQATLARWQIVFYIAAAVYLIDTIVYLFFASCE